MIAWYAPVCKVSRSYCMSICRLHMVSRFRRKQLLLPRTAVAAD